MVSGDTLPIYLEITSISDRRVFLTTSISHCISVLLHVHKSTKLKKQHSSSSKIYLNLLGTHVQIYLGKNENSNLCVCVYVQDMWVTGI